MATSSEVLATVLKLPLEERAHLAHELIVSLDEEDADPEAEALWDEELIRRSKSLAAGTAKLIDGDVAHAQVRAHLAEIRSRKR